MPAKTICQRAALAAFVAVLSACSPTAEIALDSHHEAIAQSLHYVGPAKRSQAQPSIASDLRERPNNRSHHASIRSVSYHREDPFTGRITINLKDYFRTQLPAFADRWFEGSDHDWPMHSTPETHDE